MKKLFTTLVMLLSTVAVSMAAYIDLDFANFKPEAGGAYISSDELLSYVNSEAYLNADREKLEGVFTAADAEQTYGYPEGLGQFPGYKDNNGALYIKATDAESKEDAGEISFKINPKFQHKNTNFRVYGYIDIDSNDAGDDIPIYLEISINGEPYVKAERTVVSKDPYNSYFSLQSVNKVIREVSIRVPNPYRNKKTGELLSDGYLNYFFAMTSIRFFYSNDETPEKVSKWEFAEADHTVKLEDAASYIMPQLKALPEAAAEYALFSSSNPDVAEINDGKVAIKGEGKTTISASLAETPIFVADQSLSATSYNLTVEKSVSTAVNAIFEDADSSGSTLFDINGREVNGVPDPGIYIEVKGNKARKIIVR